MSAQASSPLAKSRLKAPPEPVLPVQPASPPPASPGSTEHSVRPSSPDRVTTRLALTRQNFLTGVSPAGLQRGIQAVMMVTPALVALLWLMMSWQPQEVRDWPFPMWYGPWHLLSWWIIWQGLGQLTKAWRQSALLATFWQVGWFLKLQNIAITWQVVALLLVLFGTIELCANLFTRFTRFRPSRSARAAVFGVGRSTSSRRHR